VTDHAPEISKLFSIGKSSKGRNLWVVKISKDVGVNDDRPEFKYIANMHGDEIVGRELMVKLIKELIANYGKDPKITNLIDRVQIYIMPSMNPDGAATASRGNGKYVDLNRDFPDFSTSDNIDKAEGRQAETIAVMNWQKERKFVLSANFHGGAEVVNYPWDTSPNKFPEEDYVKELSLEYAGLTPYINASTVFNNGITNGYKWYEVDGGMQDWSIYYRKDLQLTIELSNTKWPDYSKVEYYYAQNKAALLRFIERAIP
ncbi:MAG: succinylglutamate desuccinylase/aspartoacylase family protein, partial [Bdellovibrionales bacterium]|nr:succinylglutamate desuccinylase/aspartoacylase family protein [Bdellovibrionales bacterium]